MRSWLLSTCGSVLLSMAFIAQAQQTTNLPETLPNNFPFINENGAATTFSTTGPIHRVGAFFEKLGTNNRTCETCHAPSDGWGFSAHSAQVLFLQTEGTDAVFEFDGHNCPTDDRSTVQTRRQASSLLLTKSLFRFDKALPETRELDIVAADGLNCATNDLNGSHFVYRKTLAATNFQAVTTVLWDGAQPDGQEGVRKVANGAVFQHSERFGPDIAEEQKDHIVNLGNALSSAQLFDARARSLTAEGARGGAKNLSQLPHTGAPGFSLFKAWLNIEGDGVVERTRRSIARGEVLFNKKKFGGGKTCTSCHSVPNLGNSATGELFDTGLAGEATRTPDLPLYTVRNRATSQTVKVTDLGRATVTGKWADIGKFKPPMLRGLSARPPYFHNGFAETLDDVVGFYDQRFNIRLTPQEAQDLASFLKAL